MGIEQIANKYKKTEKDPEKVWANVEMDNLRRKECLCVNCDRKNEEIPYGSCPAAGKLYNICVEHNMAMAVTRCGAVDDNGELLYRKMK